MTKDVRFIRVRQVIERLAISRTTLWRLIKKGEFPPPVKISKYASAWVDTDVEAYIRKLIRRRDAGAALVPKKP